MEVREIPGWRGYFATDDGRILSTRRVWINELKPRITPEGYLRVHLVDEDSVAHHKFVHALILEAFSGSRPPENQCRHLNGVKTDNRLCNLVWGTVAENHLDKQTHRTVARGSSQGGSKLVESQVKDIKVRLRSGEKTGKLANDFAVSRSTIDAIKYGRNWAHIL